MLMVIAQPTAKALKTINRLSSERLRMAFMSLELLKSIFEYGGVILLFLTFIFGAGVVITTNQINDRQAGELREFSKKLTDAQTELEKQKERAAIADGKVAGLQTAASDAKTAQQRVEIELS